MEKNKSVKNLVNEKVTRHDGSQENSLPPMRGRVGVGGNSQHKPRPCGCNTRKLVNNRFPALKGWGFCDGNPQSLINDKNLTSYLLTTSKKAAFTLAEVLITLGVIGIVAAMTIPNLVQSYKKKVVETKLAKFYSMMNNAIRMAEVDYGPQSTWTDYLITGGKDDDGNMLYDKGDKFDVSVKKYFAPYIKITGSEEIRRDDELKSGYKVYYLSDGTAFGHSLYANTEIYFYTDNPKKCLQNSNAAGTCAFVFSFVPVCTCNAQTCLNLNRNTGNGMQTGLYGWDGDEEHLMTDSVRGCNNGNGIGRGTYCTEVIRRNGWKIPEDYPLKF